MLIEPIISSGRHASDPKWWETPLTFERFTDRGRRVLVIAQEEARQLNHNFIGTEHVLLGLLEDADSVAGRVLRSFDVSVEVVRDRVLETVGPGSGELAASPPFTPRAKKVLELSLREALQLGHNYIGTEHILLGVLREGEGVGGQILTGMGVDLVTCRQRVVSFLTGAGVEAAGRARRRRLRPEEEGLGGLTFSPGSLAPQRRRFGPPREPLRVGDAWTVEVIRAGRSADAYAAAWAALGEIVGRLGFDIESLEPDAVTVSSVETKDGPGVRLLLDQSLEPDDPSLLTDSDPDPEPPSK